MSVIRIAWGEGTGPTALSAYDAALADAGLHNYNLVTVSSVIPADASLAVVETAPDLGPAGERLAVVEGRKTVSPATVDGDTDAGDPTTGQGVAALAWTRDDEGRGLFYETSGTDPQHVREVAAQGIQRGRELREWSLDDPETVVRTTSARPEAHACVVVCGVYGESAPLL
jgi:arginine decarboxylase